MSNKCEIILEKLDLHVNWRYDGPNTTCSICRKSLQAPSPNELSVNEKNYISVKGEIVKGKCCHLFHKACMDKLISNGNMSCPIDNTLWETEKIMHPGFIVDRTTQHTKKESKKKVKANTGPIAVEYESD
jgi:hypothetical protein